VSDFTIDNIDVAVLKLMEVDGYETPECGELADLLDELADGLSDPSGKQAVEALTTSARFLRLGLEDQFSFAQITQLVSRTLSCLQDVKLNAKELKEIEFPQMPDFGCESVALEQTEGYAEAIELAAALNADEISSTAVCVEEDDILFNGDTELLSLFLEDATENLESVESDLLQLEQNPKNPEALDAAFRSFHSVKGSAGFAQLVPIEKIAHALEELLDLAREGQLLLHGDTMDLVLATLDCMRQWVVRVDDAVENKTPLLFTSEGEEYIERIRAVVAGFDLSESPAAEPQECFPDEAEFFAAPAPTVTNMPEMVPAPVAQEPVENEAPIPQTSSRTEAVRVDRHRLDELIDLIGELVITESMVASEIERRSDGPGDTTTLVQLRKITRELQELSLSLRMMPIHGVFQKAKRVVRDLSRKLNKPAELIIEGAETELDKSVLDELGDPIVHLIRNAVDHGIETSEEDRVAAGKDPVATITVRAFHQGGNIYVEIEDDGRGLDPARLISRAVERGIVPPGTDLTDEEAFHLIFEPGFSTAEKVTAVSGRGVGMDVVRQNIEALRGSVGVSSTPGRGTCISLRLPLTLAIIDGMVVRVRDQRYIIPTLSIVNQLKPQPEALSTIHGRGEIVAVRGKNVPFHRLAQVFSLSDEKVPATESTIILIEEKERLAGLLVDEVMGQQQVVIKSLGTTLSQVSKGFAGAAVMPDGEVGLILDVHEVLELARGLRGRK